ncbi:MAG: hypothetical protein LBR37_03655, partial [Erysipelotrichaceae bacterium]|nr:hypothetical protein [Erysipelotrichaceae bacterium]
ITTTASFAGLDLPAIINPSDDENEWLIDPPSTQFELKLLLESYGYTVAMLQGDGPLSSYADDFGINVRDFDAYLIAVKETSYYHIFYFASEAVALTALEAPYTVATEADGATVIQVGRVLIFDFS